MTRDDALRALAADFTAGHLAEDEYVRRDAELRAGPARLRFWPPRRRPKVRDQERRKRLAFSGPLPPALACRFTVSQVAVLAIVAQHSELSVVEIAARAGVSTRTVQMTVRLAEADGLIPIRYRQVRPGWNNTNVITIVSRKWRQWIQRGRRGGGGTTASRPGRPAAGVVQTAPPPWIEDIKKGPSVRSGEKGAWREEAPEAGRDGS